ncbi:class I SAM-dependent methyltransferase [Geomonas subterranea]|uniref:class I SAM-dependent methyltransferase n=1 Tax=Geomonas subterranea TaxID=2847989 RepID=UPI001CD32A52|nr:class I SAM-dependent methyltransferase [Geomonas fuzhouensis]
MSAPVTLHVSDTLLSLMREISVEQAALIGADPPRAYQNYYLDFAAHFQALYPVGAGLGIDRTMSVLEVGSGIGTRCLLGTGLFGGSFTGIEPCANSYAMLGRAIQEMKALNPHLDYRYLNAGGEDTGLPSESFDVILSFEVMEHVREPEQVLREMYRLLKPGGRLFLSTCNYDSFYEGHYRCLWFPFLKGRLGEAYAGMRGYNPGFVREINFITKRSLLRGLSRAGFTGVSPWRGRQVAPAPQLRVVFPEGYAPESGPLRKSFAGNLIQNRKVHALLSRFDREYKLYIEATK